jgi:hypothetical protein
MNVSAPSHSMPTQFDPAPRAVVSDDGQAILTVYDETGAVDPVELSSVCAVKLAARLLEAALPRLRNG